MKRVFTHVCVIIGSALLLFACSKANADLNQGTNNPSKSGKAITISATLTDALTKVSFTPEGSSTPKMALAWESGDKLRVANHNDHTLYTDFVLVDGATTKVGVFRGEPVSASSYDIWVLHLGSEFNSGATQTQASEGDTRHIQYVAQANDVTDLNAVVFSDISSVLGLKAKLPSGVATTITSVELIASNNIFFSGNTLTINLTDASGAAGDVLNLYATLPSGNKAIPDGTTLLVKFNSSNAAHTVYTRYVEFPDGKSFASGCLNHLQINCVNTDKYAGKDDDGTSAHPYLIADKYQLKAVYNEMQDNATKYFKMVDDVDMNGETWTRLNDTEVGSSTWPKGINFDGNGKTISNLNKPFIYVLQGSVYDLTFDHSTVSAGSGKSGILACFIKVAGNTVTNVDITNSSITGTATNAALIGQIDGDASSVFATISDCDISNTDVTGGSVTGGVIGFANAKVSVESCTYSGGKVTNTTGRFAGGFVGSTLASSNSTFTDCHVTDATVDVTVTNNDFRAGGFVGQLQTKCSAIGCTVGTSAKKVSLELSALADGKVYNAGGFVGVNYGTITQNGSVRSEAHVSITAGNTDGSRQANLGGFAGYNTGTIKYSDADVSATALNGSHIGGFVGYTAATTSLIEHCTASGSISGTLKTGGFVGVAELGSMTDCESSTVVSKAGTGSSTDFGGFVGMVTKTVTLTKCRALADITINTTYVGGFAGSVSPASGETATISKCWSTGVVTSSSAQCGGFIGHIDGAGTSNVSDSYETGNMVGSNQRQGGFIGQINNGTVTISRCYSAGSATGSFGIGGLVGYMNVSTTIQKCVAWNSAVTAATSGSGNWSSGAIIGVTFPTGCTLTDNYRNPGMSLTAWWVPDADYDQPNVSGGALTVKDISTSELRLTTATSLSSGQDNRPQYAYHGKVLAGMTLSELAQSTLGWDSTVWDFSNELPTLLP